MTVHNEAKKEDIAKTVLMPGDPMRAKMIAEKYLDDYKLVNSVRGMYAYTGFYKGNRITVMASGMGIPSMGIYSYELYKFYDVDNIIRIGTCGSLVKDLNLYDIVVACESYSESTYGVCYGDTSEIMSGSEYLITKASEEAIKLNKKITKVRANTSDTFYAESDIDDLVNNKGCSVIEMETFGLYFNAKYLNKKALAIYTVSDNLITKEKATTEERQNSFTKMIEIALDVAINL
jgi:purine-nucleoside phosphorylase